MMTESKSDQQIQPQTEPTVLDYVLAKLMPWRGPAPEIPAASEHAVVPPIMEAEEVQLFEDRAEPRKTVLGTMPWRVFGSLFLALVGQYVLMPPLRKGLTGGIFILLAVLTAWWAVWKGELSLVLPKAGKKEHEDLIFDPRLLAAGVFVSLIAFFSFSNNLYTDLNVTLWLAGIGLVVWSFWIPRPKFGEIYSRVVGFFRQREWKMTISRQMVLILAVMAVAVFFRTYQLGEVVPEMFSDQAEKLWDVYDLTQGETRIFFPRNTGREGLQFYLIAWTIRLFDTGFSFLSMKIGTVFLGIVMLPYLYLLGKELGNPRVGLLAMLFGGISYWPNVLARVALRFILYPAFAAPALYYLVRGLRTGKKKYLFLSGIFLGIGLHGYSPFRVVPIMVVVVFFLYWLHNRRQVSFQDAVTRLGLVAFISLTIFLPLLRVWAQMPELFIQRTMTRLTNVEVGDQMASGWALVGVFLQNVWNGLLMFNYDSGSIWVNTIPHTPSLDMVSGAALILGASLVLVRYLRKWRWEDGFLLFGIPILMLPSTLVLAYPAENPAPNRAAGVAVVVFVLAAMGFEAVLRSLRDQIGGMNGRRTALLITAVLVLISMGQNYQLTFHTFPDQYAPSVWNTSELGAVVKQFTDTVGSQDQAWVIAYPHWVDTRLVGINAGFPVKDFAIWPEDLDETLDAPSPKLFLVKIDDIGGMEVLQSYYPEGQVSIYEADIPAQSFYIYYVP